MDIITVSVGVLGTNCYILSSKSKSCAVFDPGAQPEKIIERITSEALVVRYILLTHGHHDHIGGLERLINEYPNAEVLIGKNDLEMLTDANKSLAAGRYSDSGAFIIKKAETIADGQKLSLDELEIRALETPGHTKGGCCYICGDAIFAGDTLFYCNVGRCDLYGGDYDVMKASLRKLSALDGDYRVYPGHGQSTTLSFERQNNPYIAEALSK